MIDIWFVIGFIVGTCLYRFFKDWWEDKLR